MGLPGVVGQRGVGRWIADADVDDFADSGFGSGRHQRLGVGDRVTEVGGTMREPNPVGVVQNVGPAKALHQSGTVDELEWRYVELNVRCTRPPRMIGEGPDRATLCEQTLRDESAGEAERTGDDI